MLAERNELDMLLRCSSPVLTAEGLSVLLYHRNAAPEVVPSGSWGLGKNKTLVWKFLLVLKKESSIGISSTAASEAFPAPAILLSLYSS